MDDGGIPDELLLALDVEAAVRQAAAAAAHPVAPTAANPPSHNSNPPADSSTAAEAAAEALPTALAAVQAGAVLVEQSSRVTAQLQALKARHAGRRGAYKKADRDEKRRLDAQLVGLQQGRSLEQQQQQRQPPPQPWTTLAVAKSSPDFPQRLSHPQCPPSGR
jgi:hypothetical protein